MENNRGTSVSAFLLLSVCLLSVFLAPATDAQLTFSQNWGKRSPASSHGTHKASSGVSSCAEAYTESLLRLHELMMETYANYQQCQRTAGEEVSPTAYGRFSTTRGNEESAGKRKSK